MLNVTAQGGSNTTFDVALKNYDQKLVVGASNHLLHEGDVVTGYRFASPIVPVIMFVPAGLFEQATWAASMPQRCFRMLLCSSILEFV